MLLDILPAQKRKAISLTPLIDVVFILLLFFMLSTSFIRWKEITISSAQGSTESTRSIVKVELISESGRFLVNGTKYESDDLESVNQIIQLQPDSVFAIAASPKISTQALIDLLEHFKQAGAQHVSLTAIVP